MGAHNSHESKKDGGSHGGSGTSTPKGSQRGAVPRSSSGGDLQEKPPPPTSMVPIEKLAKLLVQKSQKEDGVNGVTEKSFLNYIFPMYPDLARQFYKYIHYAGKCKNAHISQATFKVQCEKILGTMDDAVIIETYVRMFSSNADENIVVRDGLRSLLYTGYKLSMDHYPEGPQTCLLIHKTLASVVDGCFNKKDSHSVGFVVRWLQDNCPRIILPLHRYCVHMLATRHRDVAANVTSENPTDANLQLDTPVLEVQAGAEAALLPASAAWLLAAAAPPAYSKPVQPPPQPPNGAGTSTSRQFLARLVCAVPVHWTPLYSSREDGRAANRFLHHTLEYRGPTLVLFQSDELVVVVCSPQEWHETHQYWGNGDCALIQLYPTFGIVQRAPKMLYLNMSIRGYPKGLRAGADPTKPLLEVDEHFDNIVYKRAPYPLHSVEVWGCGDQKSRETQLEMKKWHVKEAERQRQVKMTAQDWIEHPDRYLLELAGRPQYNNSAS